jgi:molybdate transport system regulatory protein
VSKKKIRDLLKEGQFTVNGSLWLEGDGRRFFGPGPVELLELIRETGSINQAAKKMQMSYKKAWELVNNLNAMSAHPMVITATGGEKGGGSSISEEAIQMIDYQKRAGWPGSLRIMPVYKVAMSMTKR